MTVHARLRQIHRLATLVVGAQLLVWTLTGVAFSWFDFDAVRGRRDRAAPAPMVLDGLKIEVGEAIARARASAGAGAVATVELRSLFGRPVWAVGLAGGKTVLVDGRDGAIRPPVSADEAGRLARAASAAAPPVATVEAVSAAPDIDRPAWRVRLADARRTDVFVAIDDGAVLGWHNDHWRWFDRLWSLHVLGYVNRDNPAHVAMRILAALAALVAVSGALLLSSRRRPG